MQTSRRRRAALLPGVPGQAPFSPPCSRRRVERAPSQQVLVPNSVPSHCPQLGRRADSTEAFIARLRFLFPNRKGLFLLLPLMASWAGCIVGSAGRFLGSQILSHKSDPLLRSNSRDQPGPPLRSPPLHLPPKETGVMYGIVFQR